MATEIFHKIKNITGRSHPGEIKKFLDENEKYLSPAALVFGFILDSLTLTRVDLFLDNFILLGYLFISGASILLLNANDSGRLRNKTIQPIIIWLPLLMQFAFGGLFSGFVVLYSRSASLSASWPFLLILLVVLIGNEFLKKRYSRLLFQLGIYFIAIFSYLIFAIPVILNTMGPFIFLISGIISLVVIAFVIRAISKIAPWKISFNQRPILTMILGIFFAFNILYFTNVIPPIPLSLKDIAIAHNVERHGPNSVQLSFEPSPWYVLLRDYDNTYHRLGNEPVYIYSSIFAPTDLTADIIHEWAFFDENLEKWVVTDQIKYPIFGGRDDGYRGFSVKSNISAGKWRIDVKTKRNQLLGRIKFEIKQVSSLPELKTEIR